MRSLIDIITEATSMNEVFNEAREALTASLKSSMSYQYACTTVINTLTALANKNGVPEHPIRVLVDIYPDNKVSRLTAHEEGAFMVLSFQNVLPVDWGNGNMLDEAQLKTAIFRLAQAFAKEMQHYNQYLRNWSHFEQTAQDTPDSTANTDAASAARELVDHFGSAGAAIQAMKTNIHDAVAASETMSNAVRGEDRETVKRFLSDLYRQLQEG